MSSGRTLLEPESKGSGQGSRTGVSEFPTWRAEQTFFLGRLKWGWPCFVWFQHRFLDQATFSGFIIYHVYVSVCLCMWIRALGCQQELEESVELLDLLELELAAPQGQIFSLNCLPLRFKISLEKILIPHFCVGRQGRESTGSFTAGFGPQQHRYPLLKQRLNLLTSWDLARPPSTLSRHLLQSYLGGNLG